MSAKPSLFAEERGFLVPWMKQHSSFIDPVIASKPYYRKCLDLLGTTEVPPQDLISSYILPLPSMLTDGNFKAYKKLILAISSSSDPTFISRSLSASKFAVDGNRSLRKTTDLFDHDDKLFICAFRGQSESRFLHADVQTSRELWITLGLRQSRDGMWSSQDYFECLQYLSERQFSEDSADADEELASDTRFVLSLLTAPNSSIRHFTNLVCHFGRTGLLFSIGFSCRAKPQMRQNEACCSQDTSINPLRSYISAPRRNMLEPNTICSL